MMRPEKILYETEVTAMGGRDGKAASADGLLSVSLSVPMYGGEERAIVGASRPNRMKIVGGALAVLACAAMILSAFTAAPGESVEMTQKLVPKITPKFVDWKKEDAGSDDMNLHLQVADALAKADGLAEKNLSPVPEKLLKEAQQAAEEQRAMPGIAQQKEMNKRMNEMRKQQTAMLHQRRQMTRTNQRTTATNV